MVNMVGFHHKEPTYNTAKFGEPGFYMRLRPRPKPSAPFRATVFFPCGWATFDSIEDAGLYLNHPGDVPHAARYYIEQIEGATK